MLAKVKNISPDSSFVFRYTTFSFNKFKQNLIGKIINVELTTEESQKKIYEYSPHSGEGWFFHESWLEFELKPKQNIKMKFLLYKNPIKF
jgi:hypothetical protein